MVHLHALPPLEIYSQRFNSSQTKQISFNLIELCYHALWSIIGTVDDKKENILIFLHNINIYAMFY